MSAARFGVIILIYMSMRVPWHVNNLHRTAPYLSFQARCPSKPA
jgi:hypothetical protein